MNHQQLPSTFSASHPASSPRFDPLLFAAIVFAALMLSALSVARYSGYNAGMLDLGNMAQAIGSVGRGLPLISTFPDGPTSRLALHVELIYLLFAPPYWLWPDPRLLVVGQALLFALGALPVYGLAYRNVAAAEPTARRYLARCLALIYLLYPTAQASVLFDFHGDTLAMPLLLWALDALDRRAWRSYAVWLALALSCKFYVAVPVAALGALLWLGYGQRRVGLLTLVAALCYGALAFFVVRPLFTTAGTSQAHRGLSYLSFYFGQVADLLATLPDRFLSVVVVLGPVLLLLRRGWPWLLPGLPVAAAALLSTGPGGAYDYRYHHYALVVPFILLAAIKGAGGQPGGAPLPMALAAGARRQVSLTLATVVMFSVLLVDTPLNPLFWVGLPGQGLDSAVYGATARDRIKDRFLAEVVPPHVPLAASSFLAPHLANRTTLYLVRYPDDPGAVRLPATLPRVDYALADALFDWEVPVPGGSAGGLTYERDAIALLLRDPAFALVSARDGLLLFQRGAPADRALPQEAELLPAAPNRPATQRFGDGLELVDHGLEVLEGPLGAADRRLRASFTWRATRPLGDTPLIAVSTLAGVDDARFVHLPSYLLLPTSRWQPGQLVNERFELPLPPDLNPGRYTWRLGWYRADLPRAFNTDDRSRFGEEIALIEIELR